MKFKDLPDGKLFQFSPEPGAHETALKVGNAAYLLRTGERVEIHPNRNCHDITPLKGDRYRLGVDAENTLTIFSQANETHLSCFDFLVIGHILKNRREIRPVRTKPERAEFDSAVDIILTKIDASREKTGNLLRVLKDTLFDDDVDIIRTDSERVS